MKPYICKVHGAIEPYVNSHMDDRGNVRAFRTCPICKSNRTKKRYAEKTKEIAEYHAEWYKKNRTRTLAINKVWREKLKSDIIDGYGGECECCRESNKEFLSVDHINGNGKEMRKTIHKGYGFYRNLLKLGFPKDNYRLLCMNCNFSYGKFGYCPHQKK